MEEQLSRLQLEAEALAEHLDGLDMTLDSDQVAGIIRMLMNGHPSQYIVNEYELTYEDGA